MKIQILKKTYSRKVLYRSIADNLCCADIRFDDLIKIVVGPEVEDVLFHLDKGMVVTVGIEKVYPGSDSGFIPSTKLYSPIYFCPYCGERFEYEYLGEEDISGSVNILEDSIDKLKADKYSSDSVKERKLLDEKIEDLRKEYDRLTTSNVIVIDED